MNQHPEQYSGVRFAATAALAAVFGVFLCCEFVPFPGNRWVLAFSEAALVGGLADWFAVTALFRHPLGIPLPHTAILPRNKGRVGRSLADFVAENFLSESALRRESLDLAQSVAQWISNPENRQSLHVHLRSAGPHLTSFFDDPLIAEQLGSALRSELARTDLPGLTADVLLLLRRSGVHEALLEETLRLAHLFLHDQQPWLSQKLREELPWFVPDALHGRLVAAIADRVERTYAAVLADPQHELRLQLHRSMATFVSRLQTSPDYRQRFAQYQQSLLNSRAGLEAVAAIRNAFAAGVREDLVREDSHLVAFLDAALVNLARALLEDPGLRTRANSAVADLISSLIAAHRAGIADWIARTVDSWDSETIVQRIEDQCGRDLQYIRLNGTLVGGLIGVLLKLLTDFVLPLR